MIKKDIAILYKKVLLDKEGLFVYNPVQVIEGSLAKIGEKKVFMISDENYVHLAEDSETFNEEIEYVVSNIYDKSDFIASFPDMSFPQAAQTFIEENGSLLSFGLYLPEFDRIAITYVDLAQTYQQLYFTTLYEEDKLEYDRQESEYNKQFERRAIGFLRENELVNPNPKRHKQTMGFISEGIEEDKPKVKQKIGFAVPNSK